jgi:molybdenum cofactor cytidylyltransferase
MPGCKVACIILAAGLSSRFGSTKQLFNFKGRSLVQRALDAANGSLADYVILVLGSNSESILSKVDVGRAEIVLNKDFAKGQATSIKSGLSNLPEDSAGAIIMVSDQPFLASSHLNRMVREFHKAKDRVIILSSKGEARNPVLVPRILFQNLMKLKGDLGAKNVVRKYDNVKLVEIEDEKVFLDIDSRNSASGIKKL